MLDAEDVSWVSVTTTTDIYGNSTTTEAAPVTVRAMVAARAGVRSSSENFDSQEAALIVGKTLYLIDVTVEPGASDWFTVRGERYEVEGEPHRWGQEGVVVALKRGDVAP